MAAGRPTKERVILIYQAFTMAYEELKETNPTFPEITNKANEYDIIRLSNEGKIGAKTIFTSKNKDIVKLREQITENKKEMSKILAKAPTELTNKIEELRSSLGINAIFTKKIESLENRLIAKDKIIEDRENRITVKNEEIRKLRAELQLAKNGYE